MFCVAKCSLPACWLGSFFWILLVGNCAITGWCSTNWVTTTANSGAGSFSAAIAAANANPGMDTIAFQIPGNPPFTIAPTTALPAITDPVIIDATTQPGYAGKPVIELNGAATLGLGPVVGLKFSSGASTLRGLAINRFPIQLIELDSASNNIQGNFLGTDVTGTIARGNGSGSDGILVKSVGNVIGGTNSGDGNLISGGNDTGIYVSANNNVIVGNLIGVNAAGTAALTNVNNGIVIYGCSGNLIGGPVPPAANIVSGNGASGIYLTGAASTGNVIQGNKIGTDILGSLAINNLLGDGISLISTPGNLISSNLISGNGAAGISISGVGATGNQLFGNYIGTDVSGKLSLGNHLAGVEVIGAGGNQIGGTNAGNGNVISGNLLDGIALTGGTSTNLIQGNLIGLSATGTSAVHNGQNGISINGGSNNIVGGVVTAAGNVISGNSVYGIGILQLTDSGNTVLGNFIGTDITGTKAIGNTQAGVQIQACANTIGGTAAGAGNLISGNVQQGIYLSGINGNVTGNVIQGNLIGTDVTGANSLPNADAGIGISGAANNLIGGTTAAARNVISGNGSTAYGVAGVFFAAAGTTGNQLLGNYIGTDVTGTQALGNINHGVYFWQSPATNYIGGSAAAAGNVISANGVDGICLTNASWNVIQGNFIGTKADGVSALGNTLHNVELQANATNNMLGGVTPGAGNHIAFSRTSLYSGVRVRPGSLNNLISGNSIFSNAELGIDLATFGVTPNVDCESGVAANAANAGQNYPTLTSVYSGTSTRIRGTLDSKAGKSYTLQFFASPAGNAQGYGEGQVFLGQTNFTLGAACSSNFTASLPVTVTPGWVVTATATDASNNTSEFSAWLPVTPVPPIQLAIANGNQLSVSWTNNGGTFALQQTASLNPPINWSTIVNNPALINNLMVTTLGLSSSNIFYRLVAP
jgi:titin